MEEKVGDVDQEQFTGMRNAMNATGQTMICSSSSKAKAQKGGLDKALETEPQIEVDWQAVLKANHKKCTGALATMASEVHGCDVLLQAVAALPDSNEMKAVLQRQIHSQKQALDTDRKQFVSEHSSLPKTAASVEESEECAQKWAELCGKIQTKVKAFKKELQVHKSYLDKQTA